jgi:hypothetical protein
MNLNKIKVRMVPETKTKVRNAIRETDGDREASETQRRNSRWRMDISSDRVRSRQDAGHGTMKENNDAEGQVRVSENKKDRATE